MVPVELLGTYVYSEQRQYAESVLVALVVPVFPAGTHTGTTERLLRYEGFGFTPDAPAMWGTRRIFPRLLTGTGPRSPRKYGIVAVVNPFQ